MPGIEIRDLTKRFGGVDAVSQISLTIPDGSFCVFLGPSGCGKSTILNCIAGLEKVTSGRIRVGGVDVTEFAPHERNIAMVFQSSLLYPHLTARQNIHMSLKRTVSDPDEIERSIKNAADILEIHSVLNKKPSALSGGECQRVAMAKAIVREPAAFLMDEPLAALDAVLRQSLRSELVALQRRLGTTTIFVTHDQIEAMTMGDVIVVMKDGRVQQVGSPSDVYNNPKTRFVAGFIGSPQMNFIEGVIADCHGKLVLDTECGRFDLSDRLRCKVSGAGGAYTLGIRPQHMRIGQDPCGNSMQAKVYAIEYLGKEAVLLVRDGQGNIHRILTEPNHSTTIGDVINIVPDMESAFLFDR